MKNKKKGLLIIACGLLFPLQVFAGNATAWVSQNGTENKDIVYDNGKHYQDYHISVNYGGETHEAYCADFGLSMSGGNDPTSMTCEEINSSALAYVLNDPNASHEVKQLASRIVAQELGLAQSSHVVTSSNATMDEVNKLVASANGATGGSLTFTKTGGSGANVTYSVTAPTSIANVNFTCGSGCSVTSQSWNGTSGTVSVTATNGSCSFTINATYPGNAAQIASTKKVIYCSGAASIQGVTFTIDGNASSTSNGSGNSTSTGMAVQTFTGTIDKTSGGSYYEQYCDNDDNKCKEQTEFNIPTYCDDAGDKQITITAPKDVKYCILNGKDEAGNTYKMTDGQVKEDNPYCAVYCKEDYKMTMPGAKYSDSGRYFELQNTIVEATRTCYATNPKGNSDNPAIDIEQFITDVKAKQETIISAKNEYEYAKAFEAVQTITNKVTCNPGTLSEYETEMHSKSFDYKEYSLNGYNASTGQYQSIQESNRSDNVTWGGCNGGSVNNPNASAALNNLNAALNSLKNSIEHMEDCYNWTNNLCLNTSVDFDYEEQYSTSINYELVAGGGTFVGKDATYSTSKTIDNAYTTSGSGNLENRNYIYCDANGCSTNNSATLAENISTLASKYYYRKIEVKGNAEYANTQKFQTNYPSGTIDTVADQSAIRYNYSYLGTVFPVALNTTRGVYEWNLNFTQLGQYNDSVGCRNGRLDDVAKALGKSTTAGVQYVCVYVVNCPDCDYECVGEGCLIPDEPKCPECDVYCTNCIVDGEVTYEWETKSLNDFNPNDRELGANWTNDKGQTAIKEIESDGENIYVEAEYIYVMDASNMKAIRDYNKKTGTYVAEDLTFHDVGNIKNAYGTSSFLDNGQKNGFFTEKKRNKNWTQWTNISNNIGPAWK